jgi:hypothetical protein
MQAERPRLVTPEHYAKIMLDGFGEKAREFADWLEQRGDDLKFLRYGFQFTKSNLREDVVSGRLDGVIADAVRRARDTGDTRQAVIESVDDAWEVSLLKLAFDTARRSAGENVGEWKKRGLL